MVRVKILNRSIRIVVIIDDQLEMASSVGWTPEEFGFVKWKITTNIYFKGPYELRRMPGDMWLLRRKEKKDGTTKVLVKFYYRILPQDRDFAAMLLVERLNSSKYGGEER